MDWNQDEALKAQRVAEAKICSEDYAGAKKFVLKAQCLFPDLAGLSQLLLVADVLNYAQDVGGGLETNWHRVLQVDRCADEDTVRKQYRKLLLLLHPDKNNAVGAGSAFQLVKDAWAVFSTQIEISKGTSRPKRQAAYRQTTPPSTQAQQKRGTFWTICTNCSTSFECSKNLMSTQVLCSHCLKVSSTEDTLQGFQDTGQDESVSYERHSGQQKLSSSEVKRKKGLHGEDVDKEGKEACDEQSLPKAGGIVIEEEESVELVEPPLDTVKQKRKREESHTVDVQSSTEFGAETATKGRQSSCKKTSSSGGDRPKRQCERPDVGITKENIAKDAEGICGTKINGGGLRVDTTNGELKDQLYAKLKHHIVEGFTFQNLQGIGMKVNRGSTEKEEPGDEGNNTIVIQLKLTVTFRLQPSTAAGYASDGSDIVNQANGGVSEEEDQGSLSRRVPDNDIFNFDKGRQEDCFIPGQIWALYDDDDIMPRYYAIIKKVTTRPFAVSMQWLLPADSVPKSVKSWRKAGFQYTCGEFKVGKTVLSQKSACAFSHEMKVERGEKDTLCIYPRKGDVWALYKKWKPVKGTTHECEPVEVVSEYTEDGGVEVTPLIPVSGSRSVFCRLGMDVILSIRKEELGKFSHQIPAHRVKGIEATGLPENSIDLDMAAFTSE